MERGGGAQAQAIAIAAHDRLVAGNEQTEGRVNARAGRHERRSRAGGCEPGSGGTRQNEHEDKEGKKKPAGHDRT